MSFFSAALLLSMWSVPAVSAGQSSNARSGAAAQVEDARWVKAQQAFKRGEYSAAFAPMRAAAEAGHVEAQRNLGRMYDTGWRGVARDDAQAMVWYTRAAEAGDAEAQNYLGDRYTSRGRNYRDESREASLEYAQAVPWYRRAAEGGDVFAQLKLGRMYEYGRGVEKDDKQAVYWYRRAGEGPDSDAFRQARRMSHQYAEMVQSRVQAQQAFNRNDFSAAFAPMRAAAEGGHAEAQYNLGWMYENGRGVAQDDAQADVWYTRAAERGHKGAETAISARQSRAAARVDAQRRQMRTETARFRTKLKVEAETNCGPVIEMRGGLVKVYLPVANYGNEHWVQKNRIFPAGYRCRFINGQYQPPYDF